MVLGANYPLNSVGILPTDYLNNSDKYVAENLFANSRQILAQYEVKEAYRRRTSLIFRPFEPLAGRSTLSLLKEPSDVLVNSHNLLL